MFVVFSIDTRTPIAWFVSSRDAANFAETQFRCDWDSVSLSDASEIVTRLEESARQSREERYHKSNQWGR